MNTFDEVMRPGNIESPFNACMHRFDCNAMKARLAEVERDNKRMRYALKTIADEVYDPWTNGAEAGRLARSVLDRS
jgi:hypothetical protein